MDFVHPRHILVPFKPPIQFDSRLKIPNVLVSHGFKVVHNVLSIHSMVGNESRRLKQLTPEFLGP